jgi:hypothetical protein
MMYIVWELPEHVELSEHLKKQAEFYICVQSFGISYYIPATPKIRRLIGLDTKGNDAEPDRRRKWSKYQKADAIRDIVAALELQVRNVVLAGIEENVKQALLQRMDEAMTPTVRAMVRGAPRKLLAAPKEKS